MVATCTGLGLLVLLGSACGLCCYCRSKERKRRTGDDTVYSRRLSGGSSIITVGSFPVPIPHQHLDAWGSADAYDPRGAAAAIGSNPTPSTSSSRRPKPSQEQFEVNFLPDYHQSII